MINLLDKIYIVQSFKDCYILFDDLVKNSKGCKSVAFINQHGFNLCHDDPDFLENLISVDYLLRDGIGMKIALRLFSMKYGFNMNGTDFIPQLVNQIKTMRKCNFFAYGTSYENAFLGAKKLFDTDAFTVMDGFQDISKYTCDFREKASSDKVNIVVLGMGMGKQELVAKNLKELNLNSIIICGGAILDFESNTVLRAPYLFRKLGLEWLYRLHLEPKRLARRYVLGIPKFFLHLLKYKVSI